MLKASTGYFQSYTSQLSRYRQFLLENGISALMACLAFAFCQSGADRIVVGVTGRDELAQILIALASMPARLPDFQGLACEDTGLLDPRRWSITAK